ncbi:MAG: methyltransferase domain-containing protein [Candidatus Helarchaeota archaeon]|nr:methyltransferase domain-containing protein [Candidatus Helarchaeota archaeon]
MKVNWNFIELMKRGREGYINNRSFQQFFKEKIQICNADRVLDVGCGIGTVPRLLNRIYGNMIQIYGIDLDQNLVEWGQKHWCKSENIHLSQGNIYELKFPVKDFDVITSFGLIEWLDEPFTALDEMMRVTKSNGKIITLVLEKGKYEKIPVNEKDREFYKQYLRGIENLGYPIENEGKYIQDLFSKYDLITTRYNFLIEYKTPITVKLLELWERSFNKEDFLRFASTSSDFYFQFLKEVGWTKERLLKYIQDELSLQSVIDFYRPHIGKELVQRETIIILESKLK